jgi:hypothetical protein
MFCFNYGNAFVIAYYKLIAMTKIIFFSLIIGCLGTHASAQTSSNQAASNNSQPSTAKKHVHVNKRFVPTPGIDTSNNRKLYKSKRTGQVATPTGQEATGTNGSHANNPKISGRKEE